MFPSNLFSLSHFLSDRFYQEVIRHPNYSQLKKKNDIALIRVTKPIEFSDLVRPACLHTELGDMPADVELIVTGWGIVNAERKLH